MQSQAVDRPSVVRRAQRLEHITIGYNLLEGIVSLVAGFLAGSISLVGFGLDSLIEVTSGAAILWRLHHDTDLSRRAEVEGMALKTVGICFVVLALYIAFEAGEALFLQVPPERSIPGILIAATSVVAMPLLARAKREAAHELSSVAMLADSRQTDFCTYLSAILLGGLILNAMFGWWWADPIAALVMVPIIAKEGIDALKGKSCGCSDGCH